MPRRIHRDERKSAGTTNTVMKPTTASDTAARETDEVQADEVQAELPRRQEGDRVLREPRQGLRASINPKARKDSSPSHQQGFFLEFTKFAAYDCNLSSSGACEICLTRGGHPLISPTSLGAKATHRRPRFRWPAPAMGLTTRFRCRTLSEAPALGARCDANLDTDPQTVGGRRGFLPHSQPVSDRHHGHRLVARRQCRASGMATTMGFMPSMDLEAARSEGS